jgi:ankyrin repeat protein
MVEISETEIVSGRLSENEFISDSRSREDAPSLLGSLLLHYAYFNDIYGIEQLLDKEQVSIDFADESSGLTALHLAVGGDCVPLARMLIERGASFLPDKQGRMPTTIAADCQVSDEMCDFIAEAEAKAEGV